MSEKNTPPNNKNKSANKASNKPAENQAPANQNKPITPSPAKAADSKPVEAKLDIKPTSSANAIPEPIPAEKKADSKTSLPPPPPPASPANSGNRPAAAKPAEKKSSNGLALLALLIALAAAGTAGYATLQAQKPSSIDLSPVEKSAQAAEQQALAAENRANEIAKTVEALQSHVANQAQALDKAEVSQLIAAALQDYAKNNPQNAGPSEADLAKLISQATSNTVSKDQVQTLIADALSAQQTGAPTADFTQALENIHQSEQQAKQTLNEINNQAEKIHTQLNQQAEKLSAQLQTAASVSANPQPLITALTLANIAAQSGNYTTANQYLSVAQDSFSSYHLESSAYAQYQSQVAELQKQISKLAGEGNPIAEIDNIINTLPAWQLKKTTTAQPTAPAANATQGATVAETAENIGSRILHRTFTVVRNDDAGLTWINAHPDLQVLIRENVRLDLAFARNALQLRDTDAYQSTMNSLIPHIQQYFNESDANVKNALTTLQALAERANTTPPDINTLITNIQQTAAKE